MIRKELTGYYINLWFAVGPDLFVHAYTMCGCPDGAGELVLALFEPSSLMGPHSSITGPLVGQLPGATGRETLGDYTTRRPPADIDALPAMTEERYQAVHGWYERRRAEACEIIRRAFPDVAADPRAKDDDGEIRVWGPEWARPAGALH